MMLMKTVWLLAYISAAGLPSFGASYFTSQEVCEEVTPFVNIPHNAQWVGCVAVELPDMDGDPA